MQPLLNTLYVTQKRAYLARDGETVKVRVEGETKVRLPIHTLGSIVCFGRAACSPPLLQLCGDRGVSVTFLSVYGRFYARLEGPASGNVLLRRAQYRAADDEQLSSELAQAVIIGKVANSRAVLLRAARDRPNAEGNDDLTQAASLLAQTLTSLERPTPLDSARGFEGDAGRIYFGVFDHLITAQKSEFFFRKRSRRPPLDRINCLLSFLYTMLLHDCRAAAETVGLDPAVGFLHRDRPGRLGLALDLMEEFRPILVDRLALSLVNRQQIQAKGFRTTESGAVLLTDDARKAILIAYQKRKQEEITHPFLGEKVLVGLLPHLQAQLLARHLRGDLDGYPPFLWK